MTLDSDIIFSCFPDGFLKYEVRPGVFEYYIGYQVPIFNKVCTIATPIDDTVQDFDIIPQIKFFTSADKVVFLGDPDSFFSRGDRMDLLISLRDSIDTKYGLLPVVAIISEYELDRSVSLASVKDHVYFKYVSMIERLIFEKNPTFTL